MLERDVGRLSLVVLVDLVRREETAIRAVLTNRTRDWTRKRAEGVEPENDREVS